MLRFFKFPSKRAKRKKTNLNRKRFTYQSIPGVAVCLLLIPSHPLFAESHSVHEFTDMFQGRFTQRTLVINDLLSVGGVTSKAEEESILVDIGRRNNSNTVSTDTVQSQANPTDRSNAQPAQK